MLDQVRTFLTDRGHRHPECVVCHRPLKPGQQRIDLRGDLRVHRSCATYRMRNVRAGRLGYPPR
jgi:hypothetical protein